ncbi:hypothetical protein HMPREF9334_00390 [Selenomonas infelix ATCC 43532]|uniref:Uncharacterized protein n=1 Tax=Selenomonas infelix ATCC 43532 TaxID=679201 RepID=G5GMA9_9FIRM|nr:hypothetical protein [Selenomonas infelix]EHG22354.1 hypothetical protein HMPREF9334_00390 [Selenomonas infelix ATCC 43532]
MRNITVEYLDLLGKIIVERKKQDSGIPPQNRQAENYENDLTASIRLLEKGYDVKSVMSVIRDKSPMTKLLPDVRAMVLYTGKVMENVNDVWTMRAERSLLEAAGSYQRRIAAQRSTSAIRGDYQVGMAMILKDGFHLSLVEQVIRRSAMNRDADESYFNTLFSALSDGQSRYAEILAYDADTMHSEVDVYRKFAREYMDRTHTTILSSDDEQNIIETIYRDYMQRLQEEQPNYHRDTQRMMALLEEQVQPILRKAIILASPIYVEAGRNKKEYLAGTFSVIPESLGFDRQNESAYTNLTKGLAEEKTDHKYGRAAIQLLRRHIHAEDVKRHLITLAIAAALTDPSDYAALILARAQAFLARENAIKAFDGQNSDSCINDYIGNMHCQYIEKGFVNPDMDIAAMKELLLNGRYEQDQIKDVMMRYSPNAVFDGVDYLSYVQKLADHEIARENEKLSHYVVIPRSDMRENYEEEYQYQRQKMEGRIRLPYNITMDAKIVKALLNAGVESRNLSPMLSRYKPKNWDKDYPGVSYGSYVIKQAEKNSQEKRQVQEQFIVRTRTTTNNTDNTSA